MKALTIMTAAASLALNGCVVTYSGHYPVREEVVVVGHEHYHPVVVRPIIVERNIYPREVCQPDYSRRFSDHEQRRIREQAKTFRNPTCPTRPERRR